MARKPDVGHAKVVEADVSAALAGATGAVDGGQVVIVRVGDVRVGVASRSFYRGRGNHRTAW